MLERAAADGSPRTGWRGVIRVNGRVITDEEVAREAQHHPAASLEEALREAAVALVVRELLLEEAAALGLGGPSGEEGQPGSGEPVARPAGAGRSDETGSAGERARRQGGDEASLGTDAAPAGGGQSVAPEERVIAALLEREIKLPGADEVSLRRYYENNRERFRSPDHFEASHLLFAAGPEDPVTRKRAREAAAATLEELRRDPAAFERLARERSADPESREHGGHLGQIIRGQTTPELEACLDSLSPGELCLEPVQTRYGYHILRLDQSIRGRQLTYPMARERIAEYLGKSAWTQAVHQYIQLLVGKAAIEGIEMRGATSPLVQ